MTKAEFLKYMEDEQPDIGIFKVVIDEITTAQACIGCYCDNNIWKVWCTDEEKGGKTYISFESEDENAAFDKLYKRIKSEAAFRKRYLEKLHQKQSK